MTGIDVKILHLERRALASLKPEAGLKVEVGNMEGVKGELDEFHRPLDIRGIRCAGRRVMISYVSPSHMY